MCKSVQNFYCGMPEPSIKTGFANPDAERVNSCGLNSLAKDRGVVCILIILQSTTLQSDTTE